MMRRTLSRNRGVTLVELMISVVIGLILAAAASYLFVSTTRSSKTLDARAQQQETGAVVMEFIGRDLKQAGFYPAVYASDTSTAFYGTYSNIVDVSKPAYDQGVYGCSQGVFNPSTGVNTCPSPATGEPDSLVINYFTSDNFGSDGVGTRRDCLRQSVETVTYNATRSTGGTYTTTVASPILVSNVYSLGAATTSTVDNQPVTTRSFRCAGNGNLNSHQPLFSGVEQLQFRYGVNDGSTVEAPARFYTATEVNALPNVAINGETLTPWKRVQAVQVCVLVKTVDASARQIADQGSYLDCNGNTVSYTAGDRSLYQRLVRVFGVRNNLTVTF